MKALPGKLCPASRLSGPSLPCCCSGVALIQAIYKVIFLAVAIVPAVVAGQWAAFPLIPTLVFASFLPLLVATAPWGYLFPTK